MTFTDILFIIVILFVVVLGVVYYFKTQRNKEINELDDRKAILMDTSVPDHLFTLKNMDLSGQTKRQYESLNASWQTVTNFQMAEIDATLVGADQYTEQMNLVKAKSAIDEAREILEEVEAQVANLETGVEALLEVPEANRERHEAYLERYNEARKSINNHSFDYGPAIEILEKNLQYLELNFTRYNELTSEGDYLEAEGMLDTIEADLSSLEDILVKIPKMYDTIKNDYEDSLEDLRTGYQRMVDSSYNFEGMDILEEIEQIQERLNEAKQQIKQADLADAQTEMDKADREIDSLYDFMEAEIAAKEFVNSHINQLKQKFEDVQEHLRYASIEVDRIEQSYILHENEVEQVANLSQQLHKELERFQAIAHELDAKEAVYTKVSDQLRKIDKRLDEIDKEQQVIIDRLSKLTSREKEAKVNLDLFELELRNLKRDIEKHHLPGLTEGYYAKFYQVTDQIEHLSQQLNRVRVDMLEIEQLERQLEENLAKLETMTETIVDSATLTEYMIQHSNRFRFEYPEMDEAIREAEYLFYDEYQYEESLNVIERALRRVDQDGPTQVRRMYHQEKQRGYY
ncbi:selenide, water dikinase [Suicoccus acidiformans]|uniref:Septation ring formation regulator EzrA n=1 Tax=Suicoccus acidiformans TaxID=2036206 RepID=A0A347WLJ9_9LACT|nr:septation ring formation regulator EzrA [Suicoccus acidiformans]AXY25956.1 selenide, water dikinase [Suicoccus acidiformans]